MTNLVDRIPLTPRADRAATFVLGHPDEPYCLAEPCHPEVLRGVRSAEPPRPHSPFPIPHSPPRALTLIEMLVALAVTLVMMAAVVNLFANMSGSIRNRRAAIETGAQLRQVRNRLAMDLAGATCRGSTWQDPAENQGYIEILEGQWSDKDPTELINLSDEGAGSNGDRELDYTTSLVPSSQTFDPESGRAADGRTLPSGAVTDGRALGDWDDVLALTVRSESDPFTARVLNPATSVEALVESPLAEVLWFATEKKVDDSSDTADPNDGFRRVYRRVLLIAPWLGPWSSGIGQPPENVSVHWDPTTGGGQWVANTLGDLTKRENRATRPGNWPYPHALRGDRLLPGNTDVTAQVLGNALAFDVRLFDPGAPLYAASGSILEPNDFGWMAAKATAGAANATGYGAYCDLGWGFDRVGRVMTYPAPSTPLPSTAPVPYFNQVRPAGYHPIRNSAGGYPAVYDTWSYHYENDGVDQDNRDGDGSLSTGADEGANGLDDDNANGVDDRGERETAPPYDVPLRGLKVIFRVYEPDARQIRESSVTHSFKQ